MSIGPQIEAVASDLNQLKLKYKSYESPKIIRVTPTHSKSRNLIQIIKIQRNDSIGD